MTRPCEVCSGMLLSGEPAPRGRKMKRVILEGRIVALCSEHASIVLDEGLDDLAALRARFAETSGQRSAVDRRSPLNRRVFPPRPEGRRRGLGRRSTDP